MLPPLRIRGQNQSPSHHDLLAPSRISRGYAATKHMPPPIMPPIQIKPPSEWQTQTEIAIFVDKLPPSTTILDLYENFGIYGTISLVEIFEEPDGKPGNRGKIRFSPPPAPFWNTGSCPFTSGNGSTTNILVRVDRYQKRDGKFQSPIKKNFYYDEKLQLKASRIQFGVMTSTNCMMPMQTLLAQNINDIPFTVNLKRGEIEARFKVSFVDPRSRGDKDFISTADVGELDRDNREYKFTIPFGQLKTIERVEHDESKIILLITLESPPQFYRKRDDAQALPQAGSSTWSENDSWFRQTDIVYDPYRLGDAPVVLHKEKPIIDIGRWTTYRWVFDPEPRVFPQIQQALQDFNIEIVPLQRLHYESSRTAELWSLIDPPEATSTATDLHFLDESLATFYLPFEVRYQLEVCISREILNEYNIDKEFVSTLANIASKDPNKARDILEYVAENSKRLYQPNAIFENQEALSFSSMTEIPHYCAFSRKATVTPSTIYFSSPTVETTNRVLRHYWRENNEGRFLRVQFTDEKFEGRINASTKKTCNDEVFTRVYRTLLNGIRIGDRHYEFLAFGNAQFRENGAYFFCPTPYLSCNDIRQWMGNFSHIDVVAKYAARLGQCFSTTRAIKGLSAPDLVKIPDIQRNGYTFTDGVGKISPFLAQMIAAELKLPSTAPSAFQFRLGGCKGILVVSPDAKDKEVHIRKSQQKFTAVYNGLEIIRSSRFSSATLNRQTITILSALGVKDEVFLDMLSEQLSNYQNAMSSNTLALTLLNRYIDDNHMTINIASMILNGFMAEKEPFVLSLLHLWRSWSIKLLKEKAKIIVENGAFVLGCVDETNTLRGYAKPTVARGTTYKEEELPQIFIQVPNREDPDRYNVIEGICLVGRNPSLHPGDLRVVQAINVPALHHLRDVVVFPQSGERDVPSMCSGGDLDGDDFFVIWDKNLQPTEWNCEPMSYAAPTSVTLDRPVAVVDMMKFFVRYMKNDSLPRIAHAHLAQADFLTRGIKDPKCLQLAALHSKAVDYVKTGQPAEMPNRLAPKKWPHFMEKRYKPKSAIYNSEKILGQLYDKVESVDFVPQYEKPFDKRILRAYSLENVVLKAARQIKSKYDTSMRRIMAQQEIKTEFEVWSTFILSKPRVGSDYKLQEEMARITEALKDRFRQVCIDKAGGKDFSVLGPFVAAMYKVTKEEMDIALAECRSTKLINGVEVPRRKMKPESMPLISFPWLFEKELGRIATGIETIDDFEEAGFETINTGKTYTSRPKRQAEMFVPEDDVIKQENGIVVHRGEILDLFQEDSDDENDYHEAQSAFGDVVPSTVTEPTPEIVGGLGSDDELPGTSSLAGNNTGHPKKSTDDSCGPSPPENDMPHIEVPRGRSKTRLNLNTEPGNSTLSESEFSPPIFVSKSSYDMDSAEDEMLEIPVLSPTTRLSPSPPIIVTKPGPDTPDTDITDDDEEENVEIIEDDDEDVGPTPLQRLASLLDS